MKCVYVAIPVSVATLRLYVDKGRKWNAVEHLLLFSLSHAPLDAETLVEKTNLPWRLIVEVMSRLMRVGWVELVSTKTGVTFRITIAGQAVVGNDSLPAVTRPFSRRAGFSIDKITGTVFKAKGLNARSRSYLKRLRSTSDFIELPPIPGADRFVADEVISALLEEDEHCRGIEPLGSRFVDSFAVVAVTEGEIEGLPTVAPTFLRKCIINAVDLHLGKKSVQEHDLFNSIENTISEKELVEFNFKLSDLIIGGADHNQHIVETIQKSTSWIVIHSTFVTATRFSLLLPYLNEAALRGVRIDILWGKSKNDDGSNNTELEVNKCRGMIFDEIVQERIRLHSFTTNSHAKIILADNGRGAMIGTIGSCNWLSSSFESLDLSVIISDSYLVGEISSKLSKLAMGDAGHWSGLVGDLASLAANLKKRKTNSISNAYGALVLGTEHNDFMLRARDFAVDRIHIVSHKISKNVDTLVVDPIVAALSSKALTVDCKYSEYAHPADEQVALDIIKTATEKGAVFQRITNINVHAKYLAWDDDHILITSQNILSADPTDNSCSEIGIYIKSKNISSFVIDKFNCGIIEK
ncbi:phospholipase D-like domain-containing protein [Oxalobacteraceae bacterium OTU3REALA1]|nr:phospholipase D-like domain-containing protein [Oxalobacteraceae bacterium OTU3REALA1]